MSELVAPEAQASSRTPSEESAVPNTPTTTDIFRDFLRRLRGSCLRAFRIDLDVRGAGRVTFADFARSCRKLGYHTPSGVVWRALQQDASESNRVGSQSRALSFHDVDPEEAVNVELLSETLHLKFGFDLEDAWAEMTSRRLHLGVSLPQFAQSVVAWGFTGDVGLVFAGLDTSGLGRLRREDFEYLARVSRTARVLHGALPGLAPGTPLAALAVWARRTFRSPLVLLERLGMDLASGAPGDRDRSLGAATLAGRLVLLGFTGGALEAATRAARSGDGVGVTAETLRRLVAGEPLRGVAAPGDRASPKRPFAGRSGARGPTKTAWTGNIFDISEFNDNRCVSQRHYFNPPGGLAEARHEQGRSAGGEALHLQRHDAIAKVGRAVYLDEESLGLPVPDDSRRTDESKGGFRRSSSFDHTTVTGRNVVASPTLSRSEFSSSAGWLLDSLTGAPSAAAALDTLASSTSRSSVLELVQESGFISAAATPVSVAQAANATRPAVVPRLTLPV